MSSRSWLSYSYQSRFHLTPLSYETLEYASGFASEQCPEGIVAISTNTLRYGCMSEMFTGIRNGLIVLGRHFYLKQPTSNVLLKADAYIPLSYQIYC